MFSHQLGESVIAFSRQLRRLLWPSQYFQRRQRKREDLPVLAKFVQDPEALVQIHDGRDVLHAFADVLSAGSRVDVFVEKLFREKMVEDIDFHFSFPF